MVYVKYHRSVKTAAVKLYRGGHTLEEINRAMEQQISADSLRRWVSLYDQTQSVERDPALYARRGRPRAFTQENAEVVLAALALQPGLSLKDIQSHILAITGHRHPLSTISEELRVRLNVKRNLARNVHPTQSQIQRAEYIDQIAPFPSNYLVFVGECALPLPTASRDSARDPQGQSNTGPPSPAASAGQMSVLPAVSLDGMLAVTAREGPILRTDMECFLEEMLLPSMGTFPGRNSIMVMDISAIHLGGRLAELCDAAQVLLIYLPPYSPDLNPVKKVFSALKEQIKQHPILTGTEDDSDTIKRFMYAFVTPELMKGFFLASSYSA